MKAFHGDPKIKRKYLARVRSHQKHDEVVKGSYWEGGKGCAVGCTIHSGEHAAYETELGISEWLARLEDTIFEGLPNAFALKWPSKFLSAIKVGAGLDAVRSPFLVFVLEGLQYDAAKHPAVERAVTEVIRLHKEGGTQVEWSAARNAAGAAAGAADAAAGAARSAAWAAESAAWEARRAAWSAAMAARSAAGAATYAAWAAEAEESAAGAATYAAWAAESAARNAAESAAWAARNAAESAAYAAYAAAEWSAAWAAGGTAESVARNAAESAAYAAAESAAYAAAESAAYAAAESAAYVKFADELLRLLRGVE